MWLLTHPYRNRILLLNLRGYMHIWTSWLTPFITECQCTINVESTFSQRFAMNVCMIELIFYSNNRHVLFNLFRQTRFTNSCYLMSTFDIEVSNDHLYTMSSPPFKSSSLYHSLRINSSYFTSILDISYLIITDENHIVITKSSL